MLFLKNGYPMPAKKRSRPKARTQVWVYILRCQDRTLYTGVAADVQTRLARHNQGRGAKYTRSRRPCQIVYREPLPNRGQALRREAQIKRFTRVKKLLLISSTGIRSSKIQARLHHY